MRYNHRRYNEKNAHIAFSNFICDLKKHKEPLTEALESVSEIRLVDIFLEECEKQGVHLKRPNLKR